jgi:2-methylisocitrate lyase-like PEP mutase family enzyme
MEAKTVEPVEVLVRKIAAAVDARQHDETVVIARTDAMEIHGFEAALRRCKAYRAAGADVVLMHGAHTREELETLGAEVPGVHFASIGEGGADLSFDELNALGVAIAILPSSPLRLALATVERYLTHVRDKQEVGPFAADMYDLDRTNTLLNFDDLQAFDARARSRTAG